MILHSEGIFVIFDIVDIWSQKCVLTLIFPNMFEIAKFTELKDS